MIYMVKVSSPHPHRTVFGESRELCIQVQGSSAQAR